MSGNKGIYMRIIMPIFLALLGAVVGLLVCRLFVRSWLAYPAAALIGAVSAFFGLIVRDALDATLITSNPLFDSLFAALMMALLVSILANVITSIISPKETKKETQIDNSGKDD